MAEDTTAIMQESQTQFQQMESNANQEFEGQRKQMESMQHETYSLRPAVPLLRQIAVKNDSKRRVLGHVHRYYTYACVEEISEDKRKLAAEFARQFEGIQSVVVKVGVFPCASTPLHQGISRQALYAHLDINVEVAVRAFQQTASLGQAMGIAFHNAAKWLLWNDHFTAWLQSPNSQLLLVKGDMPTQQVTPLSFSSATFLLNLRDVRSAFPLYFFCGMATSNAASGPHVLLRTLIAQILLQRPCDTSSLTPQAVCQIALFDPEQLWRLFAMLVRSLHDPAVFCVLDGLARYHNRAEALFVLQRLQMLVRECTGDVVLKVLLTDPVPVETMGSVPRGDVLMMPLDPEGDGQVLNQSHVVGVDEVDEFLGKDMMCGLE
ncbi:hypothetical protein MMC11_003030 [Xylographa trunciseda]|nr:hypothetical protein [Xylographa trunciseda]